MMTAKIVELITLLFIFIKVLYAKEIRRQFVCKEHLLLKDSHICKKVFNDGRTLSTAYKCPQTMKN